jgi:opacity protein-like surface antigen
MKKITLITTLTLLMTCQAQAAKLLSGSVSSPTPTPTVIAATPVATPMATPTNPAPVAAPATNPTAPASAATAIGTGFYIGAQLGDSSVGAVMGYQFTKLFGMEISYDYFDPLYTRAVTTTIAEKNRLGASALAMFPIKFSDMGPMALYVKFGYARTTDKVTTDDPGLPPSIPASTYITTTTKTGVTGGAGIHVDMSKSATVRLGVNVVGTERTTYLAALYRF